MLVSNNLENSVIVGGASKVGLAGGPNKCASVRQATTVVQLNASNSNTLSNNTHSNSNSLNTGSNSNNNNNNNTCSAHLFYANSSDPTTFAPRQNFYRAQTSVISSHQQQQQVIKYTDSLPNDLTNSSLRGTKRSCEIEPPLDVAITKRAVGASQVHSLPTAASQHSLSIGACTQAPYLPLNCGVKLESSCVTYQQHSIHQHPGASEECQQRNSAALAGQDEDSDEDSSLDYESVLAKILNEKKLALCNSPDVLKLLNSFSEQQQQQQQQPQQ